MIRLLLLALLPLAAQAQGLSDALVPGACWGVAYGAQGDAASPVRSLLVEVPPAGFVEGLPDGDVGLFFEARAWGRDDALRLTTGCSVEDDALLCGLARGDDFALARQADGALLFLASPEPIEEMDASWALRGPAGDDGVHRLDPVACP